jgi:hypothetical protein
MEHTIAFRMSIPGPRSRNRSPKKVEYYHRLVGHSCLHPVITYIRWMETPDCCKDMARITVISLAVRNIQTNTKCAVRHGNGAAAETQPGSALGKGHIRIRGGPLRPLHRDPQWSIVLKGPISTGTLFLLNFGKLHVWTPNSPNDSLSVDFLTE